MNARLPNGVSRPARRDLSTLVRVLNRIEDPSARKLVIMSKRDRRTISDEETTRLIELCGVGND